MKIHVFSIKEIMKKSFHKTKEHWWFLVTVTVFSLLISLLEKNAILHYLFGTLSAIILTTISLAVTADEMPTWKKALKNFQPYTLPLKFFAVALIVDVVILIGFVLLVLPGIYLAIRFSYYQFYILEHPNLSIDDLIAGSFALTKGHFWRLFLFFATLALLNIAGLLLLGLGLFVTIPLSLIAGGYVYRKLIQHSHHHTAVAL